MRRKRSLPLIYRLSRPLIGGIAIAGAILTAYLTFTKLFGGEVACSVDSTAGSCGDVLNGPYGTVFGQPLSLFGCLAYLSMAAFALIPLLVNPEQKKTLRKNLENITWLLLLAGSTAMAVFSGYLMYLLAFKIQTLCFYCIGSALFALSMFILTIIGRDWEDIGQIFFTGAIVAMVTLVGALGVYASVNNPIVEVPDADGLIAIARPQTSPEPPKGWDITTISGESEIELAEYLTAIGAKKYGAFWCPHCYEQKQLFGEKAFDEIDYIECADFNDSRAQSDACKAAGITSYPTWEINGEFYQGTKVLSELAELSGYEGATEFKYKM
ncbi:MAG: vitamin K epoxide reductase family protein [Cyanobacteria bacterium P01_F01_bin.143]